MKNANEDGEHDGVDGDEIDIDEHAHHANSDGFDEDRPC